MEKEQQLVVETFSQCLNNYKNKNIILYGIGKNTEAILENTHKFNFIGLMDQNTVGQIIYGLPVFSVENVIERKNNDIVIVIIARESVVDLIFNRIKKLAEEYNIPIYDYQGNDLSQMKKKSTPFDIPYWEQSYRKLCNEIDNHDVISFDFFDTLLMRQVLYPEDVFELIDLKLKKRGIHIHFKDLRIKSEKLLVGKDPDIDDIYIIFKQLLHEMDPDNTEIDLELIKSIELETDDSLMVAREPIIRAFRYALENNKDIYVLSDMYYTSDVLNKLLESRGICGYKKIFVSNEMKCTKESGKAYLKFASFINQITSSARKKTILHIGDNRRADYDMAIKNGVDAFLVYSGYELLMVSSMRNLLVMPMNNISRKITIGMLVAYLFNDPFCLGETKGYVYVDDLMSMGYIFVAHLIKDFILWMNRIVDIKKIDKLLFTSRDGFLIQKVYRILATNIIPNYYIRSSRRAVTVPAIFNKDDIIALATRRYNGTFGDFLMQRYGVCISDVNSDKVIGCMDYDRLISLLDNYTDDILKEAGREREKYLNYLNTSIELSRNNIEKIAVFDFVTSGTIQYNLSKLLKIDLQGICFATMNLPNDMHPADTDKLLSFFGNFSSYGSRCALAKYYLIMESILTDEKDTFLYIDDNDHEVYQNDATNHEYANIKKIHDGVIKYCMLFRELFEECLNDIEMDKETSDQIFGVLFEKDVIVDDQIKQLFRNDDKYDGIEKYNVWE